MTLADQAAITGHDGQVTSGGKPGRPRRRTFTAVYKARILAAYDALPEGSPERGALLRKERIYHSHLEDWRRQQAAGSPEPGGKKEKNEKSYGNWIGGVCRRSFRRERMRSLPVHFGCGLRFSTGGRGVSGCMR